MLNATVWETGTTLEAIDGVKCLVIKFKHMVYISLSRVTCNSCPSVVIKATDSLAVMLFHFQRTNDLVFPPLLTQCLWVGVILEDTGHIFIWQYYVRVFDVIRLYSVNVQSRNYVRIYTRTPNNLRKKFWLNSDWDNFRTNFWLNIPEGYWMTDGHIFLEWILITYIQGAIFWLNSDWVHPKDTERNTFWTEFW